MRKKKKTTNPKTRRKNTSGPSRPSSSTTTSADPVSRYAEAVIAGEIIASRWVRLACERHLRDLKRRDLVWSLDAAQWAIGFFRDVLRLNGGQFEGKPFLLEPAQQFIVGSLFGWHLRDGRRRFRIAYVEMCKGNGKSPLAAGIGHYGMMADDEHRAEIYAAATKKDQAMVLFRDAVAMRDQSPELARRLVKSGVGEKCWNMADHTTGSWYRPISSDEDSQSGPRPYFALVDEVHEHKSRVVIDMLSAGFKWRRNPLMFMITNSGFDRTTVCWDYHDYCTRILKQTAENDEIFAYIACLDPCERHWREGQEQPLANCSDCDRWDVEGPHWYKANPNLGVSIGWEYLRSQVRKGLDMPTEQNTIRRLNFGYWTNQATRWLSMEAWDSCNAPLDYARLKGRSCVIGIDLANKIDIAAMVLLFPPAGLHLRPREVTPEPTDRPIDGVPDYAAVDLDRLAEDFVILPYFFIAKDTIPVAEKRDNVPYGTWVREGFIIATEGNVTDYEAIKLKLAELKGIYPIRTAYKAPQMLHQIGIDPWNSTEFITDMHDRYSINMIEVRQGFPTLSEPTKELARLVLAKKIRHGGNPVLRWMADNLVIRTDPAGNIKPDKDKARNKIDGIAALINAMSLVIRNTQTGGSVYSDRAARGESMVRAV